LELTRSERIIAKNEMGNNMENVLLDLLLSNGLHGALVVVVIVQFLVIREMWNRIKELTEILIRTEAKVSSVHAVNLRQNDLLVDIQKQTNGD